MVQRLVANWSPTTIRQTRSVLNRQSPNPGRFKPLLGDIRVNKLTTIDIDDTYRLLSRCGGHDGRPLTSGTVHRVHVVLHRALTQAVRWEWIWFNPAANSSPLGSHLPRFALRHQRRSQMLGLRWADIDLTHSASGFSRAPVEVANHT